MNTRRDFLRNTTAGLAALTALPGPRCMGARGDDGNRPNILLFFPDQHRFDWVSGNPEIPLKTPHLDWVASRGVKFTNAVTASPVCAPARACLAAGKEYDRARVASNAVDYPLDQTTFYSLLRDGGYHTMGCGKLDLNKGSQTWGDDGQLHLKDWGFSAGVNSAGKWDAWRSAREKPRDPYTIYLQQEGLLKTHLDDFALRRGGHKGYSYTKPTALPEQAYCDNWIAGRGFGLLKDAPEGKPWFIQVNFAGPHEPLDITKRMDKICRNRDFRQPNRNDQLPPEVHNALRQNYSGMVENIDRLLGQYIEALDRRGELDNTIIIYSSDHGEMLGDHNRWAKSLPYQASVGVPLYLCGPGIARGLESNALVSVMDLAATCLDYAGLPRPAAMDSRTLRPILEGKAKHHRQQVLSGLYGWRTVWDGRYKLVTGFDPDSPKPQEPRNPRPLLFDLENDPFENNNLASSQPETVRQLARSLPRKMRDPALAC